MKKIILNICEQKIRLLFKHDIHKSVYDKYQSFIYTGNDYDHDISLDYLFYANKHDSLASTRYRVKNNIISITKPDLTGSFDLTLKKGRFILFPNIYSLDSFLRVFLSIFLIVKLNGFLMHASAIKLKDTGLVFTGPSGAGKSTIVTLKENLHILSDEIIAVRKYNGSFYVYGTPFMSKFVFGGSNDKAALKSIFFLEKSKCNKKLPVNGMQAIKKMLPNILFFGRDKTINSDLLDLIEDLVKNSKLYDLLFRKDESIFDII